ncbi:amidohydrolase family protein [Antarcticibacterium sp. 1MA-6-2]|uniref:amidohydrolase family protein n=1 Tax=Antarcticibacterium sp. 1MA-6-2 TaxID=2908210 RepID=UPI001F2B8DB7|nr:amidohydrolase family protein [Antarcticibacterium sp. 1MA-6-2]UJH90708.1 amidohydrolase family protein [Antarcticibacterium sp. 1MA-6-2]
MRVDSHQHFWAYDSQRESWINENMKAIRRNFFPEDLKPVLSQHHFDGCIAVEANNSEEETQFLLDLARQNSFIKGVVGWVDLAADNCEERLEYFLENPLFKGIRYSLQGQDLREIITPHFKRGIALLSKFDLTYDLLVQEQQLPEIVEFVKEFPSQRFVLDHMAKPQISFGHSGKWEKNISNLGACDNVYCKVSGFLTETEDYKWSSNDFTPFIDTVAKCFRGRSIDVWIRLAKYALQQELMGIQCKS